MGNGEKICVRAHRDSTKSLSAFELHRKRKLPPTLSFRMATDRVSTRVSYSGWRFSLWLVRDKPWCRGQYRRLYYKTANLHWSDSTFSLLFYFFEQKQANLHSLKLILNFLPTVKKNRGGFQGITLASFPRGNKIWQEVCSIVDGDTWFRKLAIDISYESPLKITSRESWIPSFTMQHLPQQQGSEFPLFRSLLKIKFACENFTRIELSHAFSSEKRENASKRGG